MKYAISLMLILGSAAGLAAPAAAQPGLGQGLSGGMDPTAFPVERLGLESSAQRAQLMEQRNAELLSAGAVDPDAYVLGPGDVLGLELAGAFSLSAEATVAADGSATFPQFGTLHLAGLTLAQARERVFGRGREVVRGGDLGLVLRSTRVFKVFVVGQVEQPGSVRAGAVTRVSEVVLLAGGPVTGAAWRGIEIHHTDGTRQSADLLPFLVNGSLDGNPTVRDGDVIVVPPRTEAVEVAGAVVYPGAYGYVEGETVGALLRLVGVLPQADPARVAVQRVTPGPGADAWTVLPVAPDAADAFALEPRDRVLVGSIGAWGLELPVLVTGAVAFPGPFPVRRDSVRVADVIAQAGGAVDGAVLRRVVLTRRVTPDTARVADPSGTRRFVQDLTARGVLESSVDLTAGPGPYLEPGDSVHVPRSGGFVQVLGQVKRPGTYDFREAWSPHDYIDAAGGFAQQADRKQTRVTRGHQGLVMFANDLRDVAPGDLIWVPEKPPGSFWQSVRDATFLITSAATLYLLVREATR